MSDESASPKFRTITIISSITEDPEFWKDGGELKELLGDRAKEITPIKGVAIPLGSEDEDKVIQIDVTEEINPPKEE